jgi:hypothetical protein
MQCHHTQVNKQGGEVRGGGLNSHNELVSQLIFMRKMTPINNFLFSDSQEGTEVGNIGSINRGNM